MEMEKWNELAQLCSSHQTGVLAILAKWSVAYTDRTTEKNNPDFAIVVCPLHAIEKTRSKKG